MLKTSDFEWSTGRLEFHALAGSDRLLLSLGVPIEQALGKIPAPAPSFSTDSGKSTAQAGNVAGVGPIEAADKTRGRPKREPSGRTSKP